MDAGADVAVRRAGRRSYAPGGQRRDKAVTLRVTATEWEALRAAAAARGLAVGAYVGWVAEDLRRHRPVVSVEAMAELVEARRQLRRVGVNVNQIAAAVNSDGEIPAAAPAVLAALGRAVQRLELAADRVAGQ